MANSEARQALNYIIFLFFYLQFLSVVYLSVYWSVLGVDASGFYSIEEVLVQSIDFALPMAFLFLFYALSAYMPTFAEYLDYPNKSIWPGFSIAVLMCLVLYLVARHVPLEWRYLWFGAIACFAHYIKYPVAMLLHPVNGEHVFGSKMSAFNYLSIVLTGFALSVSMPVYNARMDLVSSDFPFLVAEENGRSGYLLKKIDDYFLVRSEADIIFLIPSHQVKAIKY